MQTSRVLLPERRGGGKMKLFKRLFQQADPAPRLVYETIVAAARHPVPYASWGVPDTIDGRFDLIILHTYVVLDRLKGSARQFRQELVDELFRDMDRSLREMGVSDVSVAKKIRKMAEVFYGRISAYDRDKDSAALLETIARNVYPEGGPSEGVAALTAHVQALRADIAAVPEDDILAGRLTFREPRP